MRVAFIGGTNYLGPECLPLLLAAGHDVVVAHSGAHEQPRANVVEHLHGRRDELLAPDGPVERWAPDSFVDTFAGGATADKGAMLAACAHRCGGPPIVAVSSLDVYQHAIHAGMADGSGVVPAPTQSLPIFEDAPLRDASYPGGSHDHDNVAMEKSLHAAGRVASLRSGAIYGAFPESRERYFVQRASQGVRELKLPDRGQQIFHRVAVERVARAVVAALEHAPDGFWACNVVDPYDWTFGGLAATVAGLLDWEWEFVDVPFGEADHPWGAAHPIIGSDRRLREVLKVRDDEPDPRRALADAIAWLWEHREDLPQLPSSGARRHSDTW